MAQTQFFLVFKSVHAIKHFLLLLVVKQKKTVKEGSMNTLDFSIWLFSEKYIFFFLFHSFFFIFYIYIILNLFCLTFPKNKCINLKFMHFTWIVFVNQALNTVRIWKLWNRKSSLINTYMFCFPCYKITNDLIKLVFFQ